MREGEEVAPLTTQPAYVAYQYADSEKLRIRIDTHRRYSVGAADFQALELEHLRAQPGDSLLDVGCGPGRLHSLLTPLGVTVVGLDVSNGLVPSPDGGLRGRGW